MTQKEIKAEITRLVELYNKTAEEAPAQVFETKCGETIYHTLDALRLGVATFHVESDVEEGDDAKAVEKRSFTDGNAYLSISVPGAKCWVPSGLNC